MPISSGTVGEMRGGSKKAREEIDEVPRIGRSMKVEED
jgi:hypothetical protein